MKPNPIKSIPYPAFISPSAMAAISAGTPLVVSENGLVAIPQPIAIGLPSGAKIVLQPADKILVYDALEWQKYVKENAVAIRQDRAKEQYKERHPAASFWLSSRIPFDFTLSYHYRVPFHIVALQNYAGNGIAIDQGQALCNQSIMPKIKNMGIVDLGSEKPHCSECLKKIKELFYQIKNKSHV